MRRHSTRRAFLTTVGVAGVASFAGCSALTGSNNSEPASPNNGTNTQTSDKKKKKKKKKNGSNAPGTSVDAFEDLSKWAVTNGQLSNTKQDVFQGSQSVVLEPKNGSVAKISRTFYPKTLDLSSHDLSLATKVKKPKDIKIRAEVIAPARSSMLTSVRYIPLEMDGWVRFDLGYTGKRGNPVMDGVAEVNIQIGPTKKPFKVLIDDLRKVPKSLKGKVMFQFDDGHVSAHNEVFPMFKKKEWPASAAIIPDAVGGQNRLTEAHMRKMGKAGWDMIGHAGTLLPEESSKEQKRILEQIKRYLELKGFKKGARHFTVPYHRVDGATLTHITELFETAYLQGGCPNNAKHPSNPAFISRVNGEDIRGARQIVNMATEFNQLAVIYFHKIGDYEGGMSVNAFKKVVDHVASKDVEVVTPSQLVDSKGW